MKLVLTMVNTNEEVFKAYLDVPFFLLAHMQTICKYHLHEARGALIIKEAEASDEDTTLSRLGTLGGMFPPF